MKSMANFLLMRLLLRWLQRRTDMNNNLCYPGHFLTFVFISFTLLKITFKTFILNNVYA